MTKKYKLTDEYVMHFGRKLFRIVAVASFASVSAGELGGYIEKEQNLSHDGDAWVYGNAQVYGDARVYGDAWVYGDARVHISTINIIGIEYNVTISDNFMAIGCQNHGLDDWASFDDRRILEMDGKTALKFWRKHGQYLLSLRKADE